MGAPPLSLSGGTRRGGRPPPSYAIACRPIIQPAKKKRCGHTLRKMIRYANIKYMLFSLLKYKKGYYLDVNFN